jgi:exonuclease VII large subunit
MTGDSPKFTLTQAVREQVPLKRAILEQRRIDLQAITDLLSRAANDLRASERRAVEAEERAKLAEARAADAEARERKINAQAVRAFETMKERIAQSEARTAAAEAQAKAVSPQASENEKAAEARSFALEARLQAAEMRIAAARRALTANVVADNPMPELQGPRNAAQVVPQPVFISSDADIVDTHVRH